MKVIKKISALAVIVIILVVNVCVAFSTDSQNMLDLNNIEAVANNESSEVVWGFEMVKDKDDKCISCEHSSSDLCCRVSDQCCKSWGNCDYFD